MLLNSTQKRSLQLAISLVDEVTDIARRYQHLNVSAYDLEKLEELQKALRIAYGAVQIASQTHNIPRVV